MKIATTISKDNYDSTKVDMSFNDDSLENGWIEIEVNGEKYSIPRVELRNVAEGILAAFPKDNYL